MLNDMKNAGELDTIITETLVSEIHILDVRTSNYVNVKEYGIVGNGLDDETFLFEQCLAAGKNLLIPEGCHIVVNKAFTVNQSIKGEQNSSIKQTTKRANIFNIQKEGVTIEGVTLLGTGEGFESESVEGAGTLIKSSAKNVSIVGCTFKDANYVGCFIDPESTNNVIENCQFINCWAEGISVQSDFSKVKNCYFENCKYNGCVIRGAEHVIVENSQFINCAVTDVALDIRTNYDKTKVCKNCVITNNFFSNCYICVSAFGEPENYHDTITIKNNRFNGRDNSELGVRVYYTKNASVLNNIFKKAGALTSLLFSSATNVLCKGNLLDEGQLAIDCCCDEAGSILDNIIKNFTNIAIRTRTYKKTYTHNFNISNNTILSCYEGIVTEGNYNKSIVINANSLTGCTKDGTIGNASDILVLTNNNVNIQNTFDITDQVNTFIRNGNSMDKPVCSVSTRPKKVNKGAMVFDTSYNKPIWYTGEKWVDATGADI